MESAAAVPRIALPIRVAVIMDEAPRKSTGLHAKVIAPDDTDLYDIRSGDTSAIPQFDPAASVVAFPSASAQTWAELPDIGRITTVVVLCCPWQQHHKLLALPQLAGLHHVRIAQAPAASDFWRVPQQDHGHLSTIEALAMLLKEHGAARVATASSSAAEVEDAAARSPLLFFFDLIRRKIVGTRGSGAAGGCLPWESDAREKRRRELEQPQRVRRRSVGRTRELHAYQGPA